jgi:hypothetical protein
MNSNKQLDSSGALNVTTGLISLAKKWFATELFVLRKKKKRNDVIISLINRYPLHLLKISECGRR